MQPVAQSTMIEHNENLSTDDLLASLFPKWFNGDGKLPIELVAEQPPVVNPASIARLLMQLMELSLEIARTLSEEQKQELVERLTARIQKINQNQSSIVVPKGPFS